MSDKELYCASCKWYDGWHCSKTPEIQSVHHVAPRWMENIYVDKEAKECPCRENK
jgi:hypothetical protein